MTNSINYLLRIGIPLLLLGIVVLFLRSTFYSVQSDTLGIGVTLDLIVTIPFIYFLLIRKTTIPNTTVVPVLILGLVLGTAFLPEGQQSLLKLFKSYGLPIIELGVVSYVIIKVIKTVKLFKTHQKTYGDFYDVLKQTCSAVVPAIVVNPLVTEISIIYYGFIKWRPRKLADNEFSYNKRSGTPALLAGLMFIIGAEAFAMHFVIGLWSEIAAWILTGLSVYTLLQFFGFAKSLSQRPIVLVDDGVKLRYGIMAEAFIRYDQIKSIEKSRRSVKEKEGHEKLSPLGDLDMHNLIIHLNEESELTGLYGVRKTYRSLAVHVDDVDLFIDSVQMVSHA